MKPLLPFIFSMIIPGSGQLYLRKYWAGITFLLLPVLICLLFPVSFIYPFLFFIIVSVIDIYFRTNRLRGSKKALKYLFYSLLIVVIIVPLLISLFFTSMYFGDRYVFKNFKANDYTEQEMVQIEKALNRHYLRNKEYPANYSEYIYSKPIRSSWVNDSWNNAYRYELSGNGFKLTSAGVDGVFNTPDDIVRKSQ